MAERPRLAICIPTYRRNSVVVANLARMIDEARRLNVALYVSDDSPDDLTQNAVRAFGDVHYRRNAPSLGHDRNLIATLGWPDADFVWLLGDKHWVKPGRLENILGFLNDQDLVLINSHSPDHRDIPQVDGEEGKALLKASLWHQTLTGATIYHRRVCDWVVEQGGELIVKRDFPQLSVMLGYASQHNTKLGWFGQPSLGAVPQESYWQKQAITVFADHWVAVVSAFPDVIPPADQPEVIRSHSARIKLFSPATLLDLRFSGDFTWTHLRQQPFRRAAHLPLWLMAAILLVPKPVARVVKRIREARRAKWSVEHRCESN